MLPNGPAPARHRGLWAALAAGALLSLAVTALVASRTLVLGAPDAGWAYGYLARFPLRSLTTFAFVCAVCALPLMVPFALTRRYEYAAVVAWLAVALFAQLQLRSLTPHTLRTLFVAEGPNGTYQATQQYDAVTLMRDFDRLRPTLSSMHARSNMPGKIVLVHALEIVSPRPAVLALLVVLLSNLGGVFLYLFVRDLFGDHDAALVALVFYLFVPAKLLFFPLLNTVTPAFVLLCAWLWVCLLQRRAAAYAVALGVAGYWLAFFEPTPAVLGVLFALMTAQALWRREIAAGRAAALAAVVVVAFGATHAVMFALFRFNLFATLQAVARDAVEFNRLSAIPRPYGVWVRQNLLDFLFGTGICQAALFGWTLVASRTADRGRPFSAAIGIAASLAVLDLMGINRGEVIRLWIFLACFVQIPAAFACARLNSRLAVLLVVATSLLQVAVSTSTIAFVQP